MLTPLLAAADPSKVPFFIGGGLFALWAVVLATIGLKRPDFPYGLRGQRVVILISLTLAAVAVGTAIAVA